MTVAIVGGGFSGLSLAQELLQRGRDVVVYESAGRAGGLVGSRAEAGYVIETGPNTLIDREPAMRGLLSSLGLEDKVRVATEAVKQRFVFSGGSVKAVPSSPPALLKSDLLSTRAKLRLLLEPFTPRRRSDDDESLASFARRHLGAEATAILVDAFQTGIFAGDPEKLSVSATFPALYEWEQTHRSLLLGAVRSAKGRPRRLNVYTLLGGLQSLIDALTASLAERVHLHARVTGLELSAKDGLRLSVNERGREELLEAEAVVLATPAYVSSAIVRGVDAALSEELAAISFAPIAVVHVGFANDALKRNVEGFGHLIPAREKRKALGVIYVSSLFPFRAPSGTTLLSVLVGGARNPHLALSDDGTLLRDVLEELALGLGIDAPPSFVEIVRWQKAIPQYNIGHEARLARIDKRLSKLSGLYLHGHSYRGVGLNECARASAALAAKLAPRDD